MNSTGYFWFYTTMAMSKAQFEVDMNEPVTMLGYRYKDLATANFIQAVWHIQTIIKIGESATR